VFKFKILGGLRVDRLDCGTLTRHLHLSKQISLTLRRMYGSGGHQTQSKTTHGPCLSLSPEMVRIYIYNIPDEIQTSREE